MISPPTPRWWEHGQMKGDFKFQPSNPVSVSPSSLQLLINHIILPPSTLCQHMWNPLPIELHHTLLGATFDPHFTFQIHARVLKEQTAECLKILKSLACTDWSQQKETIIMTYKAFILSKFSYAAQIWFANLFKDAGQSLQVVQNAAMRIAGC